MKFSSNMASVINTISTQLSALDVDKMTRIQASTLLATMRVRVHQDGIASDGNPIGTYTPAYVKYVRQKHGRGADNKVILSLTRSMENSMELYPIPNGTGIGFSTAENFQKARWCEENYGKAIYAPTASETAMVLAIGEDYIKKALKQ